MLINRAIQARIRLFPAIAALCTLLPLSCTQDEPLQGGIPGPGNALHVSSVRFEADRLSQTDIDTRVAGDDVPVTLQAGSIGLFRSQGTGYTSTLDNKKYTYIADKGWQPATAADTLLLNADDAEVCAYYPYNSAYTSKTALPLKSGKYTGTSSLHDPNDLCYATDRTLNARNRGTSFELKHAMALMEFSIVKSLGYMGDCRLTEITVKDSEVILTSSLNVSRGTYAGAVNGNVSYNPGTDAGGVLLDKSTAHNSGVLLVPFEPTDTGITIGFTVNGETIEVDIVKDVIKEVQAGHRYSINVTVNPNSLSVTGVDMLPWEEAWVGGDDYTWYPEESERRPDGPIHVGSYLWAWSDLDYVDGAYVLGDYQAWDENHYCWWPYCSLTPNTAGGVIAGNSSYTYANDPCSRLAPAGTWEMPNRHRFSLLLKTPQADDAEGRWFGTPVAINHNRDDGTYLYLPATARIISNESSPEPGENAYWFSDGSDHDALKITTAGVHDIVSLGSSSYTYNAHVRCVKKRETVEVAGIQWALGNLVKQSDGTYVMDNYQAERPAAFPTSSSVDNNWQGLPTGYHFEWNNLDINLVTDGSLDGYIGKSYDPADDPCVKMAPAGTWRTPTVAEFKAAAATGSVQGTYEINGITVSGRWFGTSTQPAPGCEDDYLFLPVMGGGDNLTYYSSTGYYWTGSSEDKMSEDHELMGSAYSILDGNEVSMIKAWNFPIRCVKGTPEALPPPPGQVTADDINHR